MERTKCNGRSMVESFIKKAKEILTAFPFPLPLIAMVSISGMRSCTTHIRN
jgi:hypothetical protein